MLQLRPWSYVRKFLLVFLSALVEDELVVLHTFGPIEVGNSMLESKNVVQRCGELGVRRP